MRPTPGPALLFAVLTLSHAGGVAPDPLQHNRLCREIMNRVVQQNKVRFAHSSDRISISSLALLDEIVEIAVDCPALSIAVTGHTDNTGNESANESLSKARAEAVVAYLTQRGIDSGRLTAIGAGSASPIESNDDRAGRQLNRRIEFELSLP